MSYPPPPPFQPTPQEKPSSAAWLIPVAGLLALAGAFTPWFKPRITATIDGKTMSSSVDTALYSWKDGKVGLLAPFLLLLLAVGVVGLFRGRVIGRFSSSTHGPVRAAARAAMIVGVVCLATVGVAWVLLKTQYKFDVAGGTYSWDGLISALEQHGATNVEIGHGPQLGFWLTIAAALVAIIGGLLTRPIVTVPARSAYSAPSGPSSAGYPPAPYDAFAQPDPNGADAQVPAYQPPPPTQPPGTSAPYGYDKHDDGAPSVPFLQVPAAPPAPPAAP